MRSTVRIDDDLIVELRARAHAESVSLTRMLNRTLRAGLLAAPKQASKRRPFKQKTYRMGTPDVGIDKGSCAGCGIGGRRNRQQDVTAQMKIVDVNVLLLRCQSRDRPGWQDSTVVGPSTGWRRVPRFVLDSLSGFLRIATNPRIYPRPMTVDQALDEVEGWLSNEVATTVSEKPDHWRILREMLRETGSAGNLTTDAHLAALAITPRRHAGFQRQRLRPICGPALGEPPARPVMPSYGTNPQPIDIHDQIVGATLVVARAAGDLRLRSIATRMRSILDTRPKGAPGRDKPVPYDGVCTSSILTASGPFKNAMRPFPSRGFHEELRALGLEVGNRRPEDRPPRYLCGLGLGSYAVPTPSASRFPAPSRSG